MDLLYAMRDLGVIAPTVDDAGDQRARAALAHEIEEATHPDTSTGWLRALTRHGRVTRAPLGRRRVAALAAAGVLVVGSGLAAATVLDPASTVEVASPAQLFADNPTDWNQDNPRTPTPPWSRQPSRNSARSTCPGSAPFNTGAHRRPPASGAQHSGHRTERGLAPDSTFHSPELRLRRRRSGLRGLAHHVPRPQAHAGGFGFDFQGGGFYYSTDSISPLPDAQDTSSWIIYGIIDNPGSTTKVVDATSGISTPILADGTFALVLPPKIAWPVRLEAVDGSGNVISRAYPFGGGYPPAPAQKAYLQERTRTAQAEERAARTARTQQRGPGR